MADYAFIERDLEGNYSPPSSDEGPGARGKSLMVPMLDEPTKGLHSASDMSTGTGIDSVQTATQTIMTPRDNSRSRSRSRARTKGMPEVTEEVELSDIARMRSRRLSEIMMEEAGFGPGGRGRTMSMKREHQD